MADAKDLDIRISVLENTVIKQNQSVDGRLANIEHTLAEIHNKMDSHILSQAISITKLEGNKQNQDLVIANLQKEISGISSKIAKTSSMIAMFVAALITSAFHFLKR